MILFTSDYTEGANRRIIERLAETNLVQTVGYGCDEYCAKARELVKAACGTPEADVHFLVGGTQTNATVIASTLRPYQGVLCAVTGHINAHETGAIEHGGHKVLGLPTSDGKIKAEQIRTAVEEHYEDESSEHIVQPGMVYISFPTELGTIYTKKELEEISAVCREKQLPLFLDGARLGYGLAASEDLELKDIARLCDVFYIGGTKQGALFGEAVVICHDSLKKDFRYNIKQGGGMMAKGRLLGIQFETLFDPAEVEGSTLYMEMAKNAIEKARRVRKVFSDKGYSFKVDSPTNQIFPILPDKEITRLREKFGFELWGRVDESHCAVRFCTSWATTDASVDALVAEI